MFKNLFGSKPAAPRRENTVIVVSGLPRSGTSMMMKMLEQGGVPILTDAIRSADDDNPNGYFELEVAKRLVDGQIQWLDGAHHKAVKVISALLEHLPQQYRYKILFMERDPQEILASQQKMLAHRKEASPTSDAEMQKQFEQHLAAIKYWLARQPNMEVLYVNYNRMMADPDAYCRPIADFLGVPVDVAKMRSVPNADLYRNRAEKTGSKA